jgi:tetratricopeptide (TPR) repeat protein
VWPAIVALVAGGVYLNTLSNGFALDDIRLVRDNPRLEPPVSLPGLFVQPYGDSEGPSSGLYRPVTLASLAINRAVTGPGPLGFHWVNLLLHAVASALAWWVLRRAGAFYGTAFLGGLLFAVHPLHTEAVANVAGRAELLATVGVLAAWLAHRRAAESSARGPAAAWAVAAGIFYLAATLSKEAAILTPAVLLIDDALRRRDGSDPGVRWSLYTPYAGGLLLAIALRIHALGGLRGAKTVIPLDNPAAALDATLRVATALWVQVRYAWLFVWPGALSSDYSFAAIPAVDSPADPRFVAGFGAFAVAVALGVYGWKRSTPLALGIAIWVFFFLPASNIVFPIGTIMAERLAYLPSLGACLIAGHLGARTAAGTGTSSWNATRRTAVVVCAALIVATLAARTWTRNPVWESNERLALHDVRVQPRSAKLHAGAAIVLHDRGDLEDAEHHYREALAIYPDYARMHFNLGVLLVTKGKTHEGLDHLTRAGTLYERSGRTDEANKIYRDLLRGSGL